MVDDLEDRVRTLENSFHGLSGELNNRLIALVDRLTRFEETVQEALRGLSARVFRLEILVVLIILGGSGGAVWFGRTLTGISSNLGTVRGLAESQGSKLDATIARLDATIERLIIQRPPRGIAAATPRFQIGGQSFSNVVLVDQKEMVLWVVPRKEGDDATMSNLVARATQNGRVDGVALTDLKDLFSVPSSIDPSGSFLIRGDAAVCRMNLVTQFGSPVATKPLSGSPPRTAREYIELAGKLLDEAKSQKPPREQTPSGK